MQPLTEAELAQLQALMDGIPDTLEPLDVVMIDGYLCGVLLQPQPVPAERWLPLIPDVDGRPPPARFDLATMRALVLRRHAELDAAIARRQWFDPWIYQLDDEATLTETVLPWVAGFATAVDAFTTLMDRHEDALLEPLATLYRHLDPDDLEDADALVICTEWKNFRAPDFDSLKQTLRHAVIFDGRNLYDPDVVRRYGFTYYAIGRGDSIKTY